MDPDENLAEQRELAASLLDTDDDDIVDEADVFRLAELVLALDEWLTKGGEKPRVWKRVNPT